MTHNSIGYFVEEATILRHEKDHDGRVRSTGTSRIHRDVPLSNLGTWDTPGNKAPGPTYYDGTPTSVDLKRYRKLLEIIKAHQERAKPNYQFAGELTRSCYALKLHVVSMKTFTSLADMENMTLRNERGRLNDMSRLIETRLMEAWGLKPNTGISTTFRDDDAIRTFVLQTMHMAVGPNA